MSEQIDLGEFEQNIRQVLAEQLPIKRVHEHVNSDPLIDIRLRETLSNLGWFGLGIAEEDGGLGLSLDAAGVLYEALGRHLAPVPIMPSLVTADVLTKFGTRAQQQVWGPQLARGTVLASVSGLSEHEGRDCPLPMLTPFSDSGFVLEGDATSFIDGGSAGLFLVRSRLADGTVRYVLLETPQSGLEVLVRRTVDRTRHLADLSIRGVRVTEAAVLPGPAESINDRLQLHLSLAIACDAIGGTEAILDRTIQYLKVREQFGKIVGSFQALKHRCSNLQLKTVSARIFTRHALATASAGSPEGAYLASLAKASACDAYAQVAADAVQLHGGIGYTWEHDCHLFLKRAKMNQALLGNSEQWLDKASAQLIAAMSASPRGNA